MMRQKLRGFISILFRFFEQYPFGFILLVILLANWQLLFGLYGIKWDSSNYWHPWRYFISECYNNGIVPIWDPYTQSGYPVHGDLQGPAYSIDAIVNSFLFKGSVYSINLVYIAYLVFGAFGLFKLCNLLVSQSLFKAGERLSSGNWPQILAAVVYSLSGYSSSHGHNLYIVISVGLLPWLYYYFFKILSKGDVYDSFKFAIIIFFQVTAGNPSFLIVAIYFLLATLAVNLFLRIRRKEISEIFKCIKLFLFTGFIALLLCSPVIVNVLLIFKDSTRASGVPLDWAGLENSPISSIASFISPFTGYENFVDINLRQPILSYYIGAFTICLAVIGIRYCKISFIKYFVVFSVVALLLSLGLQTPLFKICHGYLPMFNVFRMPKLVFIYIIMFLLICFVFGIHSVVSGKINVKKIILFAGAFIMPLLIISSIYFFWMYNEGVDYSASNMNSVLEFFRTTSQSFKFIFSGAVALVLVVVMIVLIKYKKWKSLMLLMILDIGVFYNVTATVRVFDEVKLSVKEKFIDNLPRQFPTPLPVSPVNAEYLSGRLFPFWMNTSIYLKQPGYSNNNSFAIKSHALLEDESKNEFQYVINLPLYTLIDSLATNIDVKDSSGHMVAVVNKSDLIHDSNLKIDSNDRIICNEFLPQRFSFKINSKNKVAFLLQQSFNKYWNVTINGKKIEPSIAFFNFPLVFLEPGVNVVTFSYEIPYFGYCFILSLVVFIVIVFVVILQFGNFKWTSLIAFVSITLFCIYSFFSGSKGAKVDELKVDDVAILYNTYNAENKLRTYNLNYTEDQAKLIEDLKVSKLNEIKLITKNNYFPPELERWIGAVYGGIGKVDYNESGSIKFFDAKIKKEKIFYEDVYVAPSDNVPGECINVKKEYSDGVKCDLNKIGVKKGDLLIVEADVKTKMTEYIGLCFSIDNTGVNKKFGSAHSIKKSKDDSQHVILYYTFNEDVKTGDELKVFFWNNKAIHVYLKRIDLKIIHEL